ncbi:MAG TPA: FAD-dependent oxidoreductase [Spirochaetota bacterium]|nr:FAD-dependent oxidoreductase [Spirochaetota bacterium]
MINNTRLYNNTLEKWSEYFQNWFMDETNFQGAHMESEMYPYSALFEPIKINSLTVKNRIIMAPMGNICMADETGRPSAKMISYFAERAKGGTGLITSGLIPVSHGIDPSVTETGGLSIFPRIDRSRTNYAGWRILAETLHSFGAAFFIQLTAGMGRVGSPECIVKKHKLPVSASWNPNFYIPQLPCRPLSFLELKRIVKNTGQAAADAKALLIDGVYLHGHEGYLLEQLSNPAFNRRLFGPYRNWQKFGTDLVREIRNRCGKDYPVMYRIDLSLMLNATYGGRMDKVSSLKKFRNERTIEMTLDYLKNLVSAGVDIIDVDLGCYDNWWLPHPPEAMPPACFIEVASLVKNYFRENKIKSNAGIEVPVAAVGKLGFPDIAERALQKNQCDMIMLGRPLLADPEWPNKVYAGKIKEIIPCIGDQEGCLNEFIEGGHPQCSVNPRTAFEELYESLPPVLEKKKVAVVGAGPAGVMCACTAAERGHDVTIFDKNPIAGGVIIAGSVPKIKFEVSNYLSYMNNRLSLTSKKQKLKIELGKTATATALKSGKYDTIVIATGGSGVKPDIPGIENENVYQAVNILLNPSKCEGKKNAVIIGGGSAGCETAHFLSYELGVENVTIVEMMPELMKRACTANRGYLIHHLEKKGVKLLNCTGVKKIQQNSIILNQNISKRVPDPYVTWKPVLPDNIPNPFAKKIDIKNMETEIAADIIILAMGWKPDRTLYEECVRRQVAPEIYLTGDVHSTGRVFEATKGGYAIARRI